MAVCKWRGRAPSARARSCILAAISASPSWNDRSWARPPHEKVKTIWPQLHAHELTPDHQTTTFYNKNNWCLCTSIIAFMTIPAPFTIAVEGCCNKSNSRTKWKRCYIKIIITQAHEVLSLKMGSFRPLPPPFFGGSTSGVYADWLAANNHVLCSWTKYGWADDVVQVVKNEMWASEVGFACLTWLYGLFFWTLVSLKNAYTSCGRPTQNFIGRFWLGSVRSASKLNSKCTQMKCEMNCITMHKCTFINVPQCTPNSPNTLASASLVKGKLKKTYPELL